MQQCKHELQTINWIDVYSATDANKAYEKFLSKLTQIMNRLFPIKTLKIKNTPKNWLTQGIRNSCKTKRTLYKDKLNGKVSAEYYKTYCKILRSVITEAKKKLHAHLIESAPNRSKAAWDIVKTFMGSNQIKNESILEHISTDVNDKELVLNNINTYLINQCPNLNNLNINTASQNEYLSPLTDSTIFLQPTDPTEVLNIIMSLNNTKSTGEDEIPVKLLKLIAPEVAGPLSYLINLTISSGTFPESLKTSYVKVVHKKGNKNELGNYRPISLLSNISKIFEKIIYNRLVNFLEKHSLLTDTQNGFRKKKSTIRAAYQAMCKIIESINKRRITVAVSLDLSKAFDSVDHNKLLNKITAYGIRGTALNLIKSYISNRTQCVTEVDEKGKLIRSDKMLVKRGVPQGSILGPLLYIIYTNDLPQAIQEYIVTYADDSTIVFNESNEKDIENNILSTLDTLEQYFQSINLKLNKNKTKLIKFSNHHCENMILTNTTNTLTSANQLLFLGLQLDARLDWKSHIDRLIQNMSSYCFALKTIAKNVSVEAAFMAYHAYMHSRIRYGIILWGNSTDAGRIFILQKRAIRNILNMKQTDSCKEIFISKNILTFISLYVYESILYVTENYSLFKNFEKKHIYPTRNKLDLSTDKPNFTYVQKNVPYSIIKIYNKLPRYIKELPIRKLKIHLRNLLLKKAYYTIDEFFNDENL